MGVRFTGHAVGVADVHRRLPEILRRERLVRGFGHRNVAQLRGGSRSPASAKLASLGFMIFGCGMEMAGITVSKSHRQMVRRQGDGSGHGTRNGHRPRRRFRHLLHLAVAGRHGSRNGRTPGGVLHRAAADRPADLRDLLVHGPQAGQTTGSRQPKAEAAARRSSRSATSANTS